MRAFRYTTTPIMVGEHEIENEVTGMYVINEEAIKRTNRTDDGRDLHIA